MKVLLIIPPMTQVNTPYPSTAYLTQFLRDQKIEATQKDLGLDLFHRLFNRKGLNLVKNEIIKKKRKSEFEEFFLEAFSDYENTIERVISFLQGKDPSLALRISKRMLLPEGPRFAPLDEHESEISPLFGEMGIQDKSKYIASLYLDDLADLIKNAVDVRFGFSHYGESLASSQSSFDFLYEGLKQTTLVDGLLLECVKEYMSECPYDVVGFTVPFPGNVYGALRAARFIKENFPAVKIVFGGGFVNTELRELSDTRIFEFIDYLLFDDGEAPLMILLNYLQGKASEEDLLRTWYLKEEKIIRSSSVQKDFSFKALSGPTYDGLNLERYIPMLEMPNPMHRMWSDFRWNKMIMAHGCYWKKCTFCDVTLDYINRYEPMKATGLVDQIKRLVEETKQTGFHFVDEAAPPALVKSMSEELIKENVKISWWGNLRFDKQFEQLATLMADSGCVAVTGGLEVASPRILKMIDKGTTVEQVARVTRAFSENGIYVHAYLMYGFPTQTIEETVDSLEVVRQLFLNECIHSAYWHRFMCTAHSPVGLNPDQFKIKLVPIEVPRTGLFAKNTVEYIDPTRPDLDLLGDALRRAVYNFMHGIGLDEDVRAWFDIDVKKTTVPRNFIEKALR
ncbi:MAG: B12-binding domain-containing radical SAM protein [Bacteriovorax sp.]